MKPRHVAIAIPACNEAKRIGACLAALIVQRDEAGAPLPAGSLEVLVFANGCVDGTVDEVRRWAALSPHPILCVEETLSPALAHAGGARRRAMDLAAERLEHQGWADGLVLTTDADSIVAATWAASTLDAFGPGIAAVAGYIDAHPTEIVSCGPAFLRRGRLEDTYLRLIAEIEARCDPRSHDPWPNHKVSSGASLAVTLTAYRKIGGLPILPVGEDAALTATLERAGMLVRHPMNVMVSTSCRLQGRAPGGAADTMRLRQAEPDLPCDGGIERARAALRRAATRGRLRRAVATGSAWSDAVRSLRLTPGEVLDLRDRLGRGSFRAAWDWIEEVSPALRRGDPLRPSDLPAEIAAATRLLRRLRRDRTGSADIAERGPRAAPLRVLTDA